MEGTQTFASKIPFFLPGFQKFSYSEVRYSYIGDITCFGLSYTMHLWRFIHFLTLATFPLQNYFQAWNQCKTISLVMPAWPAMVVMWPTLRDASKGPSPFIQIAVHLPLFWFRCLLINTGLVLSRYDKLVDIYEYTNIRLKVTERLMNLPGQNATHFRNCC